MQRSKKPQQIRGLNQNHNHPMKEIFKSMALGATRCAGPFNDFYAALLAQRMKPGMARLTLARRIAAITLTLWKKGGRFDAGHLKAQAGEIRNSWRLPLKSGECSPKMRELIAINSVRLHEVLMRHRCMGFSICCA
jgi:hypothetical protein